MPPSDDLDRVADRLVEQARADGVALTGPGGLLGGLTKKVLETAPATELTDHLGYEPGDPRPGPNARNGSTSKTVRTDIGEVRIDGPRDRQGTFEPAVVCVPRRGGGFTRTAAGSGRPRGVRVDVLPRGAEQEQSLARASWLGRVSWSRSGR